MIDCNAQNLISDISFDKVFIVSKMVFWSLSFLPMKFLRCHHFFSHAQNVLKLCFFDAVNVLYQSKISSNGLFLCKTVEHGTSVTTEKFCRRKIRFAVVLISYDGKILPTWFFKSSEDC